MASCDYLREWKSASAGYQGAVVGTLSPGDEAVESADEGKNAAPDPARHPSWGVTVSVLPSEVVAVFLIFC